MLPGKHVQSTANRARRRWPERMRVAKPALHQPAGCPRAYGSFLLQLAFCGPVLEGDTAATRFRCEVGGLHTTGVGLVRGGVSTKQVEARTSLSRGRSLSTSQPWRCRRGGKSNEIGTQGSGGREGQQGRPSAGSYGCRPQWSRHSTSPEELSSLGTPAATNVKCKDNKARVWAPSPRVVRTRAAQKSWTARGLLLTRRIRCWPA